MREKLPFPIAIFQDRYGGCYSGGPWLAIAGADHLQNGAYRIVRCLEGGPHGDGLDAREFWDEPPSWIAVGETPDGALDALRAKQGQAQLRLDQLDEKIAVGTADLEAGRVHTIEDVRAFLNERRNGGSDAAE